MTNTTTENLNTKSISLHSIVVDDQRNEASTSYAADSNPVIPLSCSNSLNNISVIDSSIIDSTQDQENQHRSKLYHFLFKKNKKNDPNNSSKYAKLETLPTPEIQASSTFDVDEAIVAGSNKRNLFSKLNNNLHRNVKRLFTNNKPKPVVNINTRDGVFSNLNEKPEIRSTRLPTYYEVTGEYANELDDPNIEVSVGQDLDNFGELLVNDLQVGSWYGFWGTILVSAVFEFIGFIFTFFLTSSHSAKDGSVVGLGVILFKYAICNSPAYDLWFIVLIILIGVALCIKGTKDFRKTKRIEKLVNSDPERYLE